jgi:hypothetical protein
MFLASLVLIAVFGLSLGVFVVCVKVESDLGPVSGFVNLVVSLVATFGMASSAAGMVGLARGNF